MGKLERKRKILAKRRTVLNRRPGACPSVGYSALRGARTHRDRHTGTVSSKPAID